LGQNPKELLFLFSCSFFPELGSGVMQCTEGRVDWLQFGVTRAPKEGYTLEQRFDVTQHTQTTIHP
jgi:hypothetical protein